MFTKMRWEKVHSNFNVDEDEDEDKAESVDEKYLEFLLALME